MLEDIELLITCCERILSSDAVRKFMLLLLQLGNLINEGSLQVSMIICKYLQYGRSLSAS